MGEDRTREQRPGEGCRQRAQQGLRGARDAVGKDVVASGGACGTRGLMPEGFRRGALKCGRCGASLVVGKSRNRVAWALTSAAVVALVVTSVGWLASGPSSAVSLEGAAETLGLARRQGGGNARSQQEASIRTHTVPLVLESIDSTHPSTRNTAVRVAAEDQGPYHVEQVARLWTHVRGRWRYVNDPRGGEYFAKASETIENEYAGDCDDFATVLIAMITAIGGDARLVMMDGPNGGHAYAEACIRESPDEAARRLATHYRRTWDEYLGRQTIDQIHFRSSSDCNVWLNLDWNAGAPGGPYGAETWAVAIYPDGRTETLAPSQGPARDVTPRPTGNESSAAPPR